MLCPRCDGEGKIQRDKKQIVGSDHMATVSRLQVCPCCDGKGEIEPEPHQIRGGSRAVAS
jgi:DnaJ-class molecular chaperone